MMILPFNRDELSTHLQEADDPRLRHIALANLKEAASAGGRHMVCRADYYGWTAGGRHMWRAYGDGGWTAERRDRLKLFQLDPSVEVSAVAAWIFPPPQ